MVKKKTYSWKIDIDAGAEGDQTLFAPKDKAIKITRIVWRGSATNLAVTFYFKLDGIQVIPASPTQFYVHYNTSEHPADVIIYPNSKFDIHYKSASSSTVGLVIEIDTEEAD